MGRCIEIDNFWFVELRKSEFSIEFCICKRYNKQRYKEVSCHRVVKCRKHSFTHR